MVKKILIGVVACLWVMAATAYAADSFKLSETYNSKDNATGPNGKLSIKAKLFTDTGVSPASFNERTHVAIYIGAYEFDGVLGYDTKYVDGAKSAKFLITNHDYDGYGWPSYNENLSGPMGYHYWKLIKYGTISLSFSDTKGISVSVSLNTGLQGNDGVTPALADEWEYYNGAFTDSTTVYISVGDYIFEQEITIAGTAKPFGVKLISVMAP